MTYITKLVLNGFKSFAKRTEIVFGNNFNTILGPNGSGKSNLLDALCFVLGRMSSKSMRAEKLAHLIYNGGKLKNPANKAEVSIYFDNSKKTFPTEELIVKLTRMVKPSGQSVYKINDERRTRQQVLDLMSVAKINPDGYNIILQGDIIKFVEMSSEERRQVIEEIAGISVYEDKKLKAMSELEKVEVKVREADILLTERKTHLKELKADRDQALKYKGVTDRLKQNKATYLYTQLSNKQKQKESVEKSIAELKEGINALQEQINQLRKKAEEKREAIKKIGEEIEEKGEKEQVRLHREVERIRVEIATSANRITTCENEVKKIDERKEQLSIDSAETDTKIKGLKEKKSELQISKQAESKEKEGIDKSIDQFKNEKKIGDLAEIEAQVEKVERETETKQAEIQSLVEQKQNLLREKDRLEFQLQGIDEKISKVLEIENEKKSQLEGLKQKREEFKKLVLELNKLLNEDAEDAAKLNSTRKKLAASNEELARLKAKDIGSKERVLGNLAVRKLLEQNEITGIYGTVSGLSSTKSKYSTALEVAAGQRLNSLVVKDDQVAAKCIKYLKDKRLGVATFLPLNKIRPKPLEPELKNLLDADGVHGLAINLVSFDQKFKNAFSYVFGDTIIVDNIDTARRLGIGKARMVSLDGDLAELRGAMIGGYRQKKPTAFKEDETSRELQERESEADELSNMAKLLEQKRADSEEKIAGMKRKKAELEAVIITEERSLHLDSGDLDASKKQKSELGEQIKSAAQQLSQLDASIAQQNRALAEIKTSRQTLKEKISELKSPMILAELNAFEQKRRELTEAMLAMDNEIKSHDTQINDIYLPERQRMQQIMKQLAKERMDFENEREQLKKKVQEQKTSLKEAEEKTSKFYVKYKALFSQKEKLNEELQKTEEKTIRKEEQIRTEEVKVNNSSLKNAEITAELSALQEEFKQYSDVTLLKEASEEQIKGEISKFERMMAQMGNVNMKALEIYDEVEQQYKALISKKETLETEKSDVIKLMQEIDARKKDLFMNTFNAITEKFRNAFQSISTKGEAYLALENEQNPFEGGVRIRVRISSNKFMDIRSLSGGEKTLTALAFIFAIQEYEPASFYILDEVDAALDKRNSEKLSKLLSSYSQKAQYIIISHNDAVVSEAANLYGISMNEHGISNVVSLKV